MAPAAGSAKAAIDAVKHKQQAKKKAKEEAKKKARAEAVAKRKAKEEAEKNPAPSMTIDRSRERLADGGRATGC